MANRTDLDLTVECDECGKPYQVYATCPGADCAECGNHGYIEVTYAGVMGEQDVDEVCPRGCHASKDWELEQLAADEKRKAQEDCYEEIRGDAWDGGFCDNH